MAAEGERPTAKAAQGEQKLVVPPPRPDNYQPEDMAAHLFWEDDEPQGAMSAQTLAEERRTAAQFEEDLSCHRSSMSQAAATGQPPRPASPTPTKRALNGAAPPSAPRRPGTARPEVKPAAGAGGKTASRSRAPQPRRSPSAAASGARGSAPKKPVVISSKKLRRGGLVPSLMRLGRLIAICAVVCFLVTTTTVTLYAHPTESRGWSMAPNLHDGDQVVIAKHPYGWASDSVPALLQRVGLRFDLQRRIGEALPARGDMISFRRPEAPPGEGYNKRVIGLPGDRVQMVNGVPVVNGQAFQHDCFPSRVRGAPVVCIETTPQQRWHLVQRWPESPGRARLRHMADSILDNTREFQVPDGHLFVLGDNRDNSDDSRFANFSEGLGFVPLTNVMGRVEVILPRWLGGRGDREKPIWLEPRYH